MTLTGAVGSICRQDPCTPGFHPAKVEIWEGKGEGAREDEPVLLLSVWRGAKRAGEVPK